MRAPGERACGTCSSTCLPRARSRDRIDQVVTINGRLYESIAPVRRAALRAAPESPAVQETLARARGWVRAEVERVFAEELATAGRDIVAAVELALSFEAWDQLRVAQGVSLRSCHGHRRPHHHRLLDAARVTRAASVVAPARDAG